MTTKQIKRALVQHQQKQQAERAGRIVVAEYPYSHNPYITHEPVADCFAGCKHA